MPKRHPGRSQDAFHCKVQFPIKQAPICPEAAAVPVHASFSLAVSRASVVALARAAFQQAAECAAVQLAAAEVRVSVPPLADDSVPDDCSAGPLADDSPRVGSVDSARDDYLVALPADDLVPVDCSAAPLADDSPRVGSVDSARDDYLVALPGDDLAPVDCWAGLPADDSLPADSADLAPVDCSAAPLADDSVAPDSSCQGAHWVRAGCPDEPESPPPVFLAAPS